MAMLLPCDWSTRETQPFQASHDQEISAWLASKFRRPDDVRGLWCCGVGYKQKQERTNQKLRGSVNSATLGDAHRVIGSVGGTLIGSGTTWKGSALIFAACKPQFNTSYAPVLCRIILVMP